MQKPYFRMRSYEQKDGNRIAGSTPEEIYRGAKKKAEKIVEMLPNPKKILVGIAAAAVAAVASLVIMNVLLLTVSVKAVILTFPLVVSGATAAGFSIGYFFDKETVSAAKGFFNLVSCLKTRGVRGAAVDAARAVQEGVRTKVIEGRKKAVEIATDFASRIERRKSTIKERKKPVERNKPAKKEYTQEEKKQHQKKRLENRQSSFSEKTAEERTEPFGPV